MSQMAKFSKVVKITCLGKKRLNVCDKTKVEA